ncbi:MAG: glycosyltransferase family 4 protein [Deltaproteobacteria bacterium]|nr:glycosyltransferase family 4 protein [Deltaproteobacteria bacterium]
MKLLFLAPQPFFQERGTPIAVRLALTVIAERNRRNGDTQSEIDLLAYHEGQPIDIPNVALHRITVPRWLAYFVRGIGPGVSVKKLICDILFLFKAFKLVRAARKKKYDLVHAVEEGVYVAMLIKWIYGIPYIYDMDSSLAMQVTEKWRIFKPLYPVLSWLERLAIRNSAAVAPVCDALGVLASNHGARKTFILRDVSLLNLDEIDGTIDLRAESGVPEGEILSLYVGNLEHYQGIDLMIESFASVCSKQSSGRLIIIGGSDAHLAQYKAKVRSLGLESRIKLLGPRPVSRLGDYITQADILVSPRIKGNNTPMKLYSYMHAGKALLATELATHTQVLDSSTAMLTKPDIEHFAAAWLALSGDDRLRRELGLRARATADEKYTFANFSSELNRLYEHISQSVGQSAAVVEIPR